MVVIREVSTIVVRIAEAVADARGVSPKALDPLGSSFDVDALERFIESASVPVKIAFELEDCTVIVDGGGNVAVSADPIR